MIWFDIKKLENKILRNELTDKEGYYYFLANSILTLIAMNLGSNDSGGWKITGFVVSIVVTIWGIQASYSANNEVDGKDFLKRFLAFGWVIGMRLMVVLFPVLILGGIIFGIYCTVNNIDLQSQKSLFGLVGLVFMFFFTVICYLLIINSFRRLR